MARRRSSSARFIDPMNVVEEPADGLHLLHSAIAVGASFDSAERQPCCRCHPQTRQIVFEIILSWTKNVLRGPRMLWIHGDAGSGKTAIAQSVAEFCAESGQLGATFFFAHGMGDLADARFLVATLAYKLARSNPALRTHISRAIERTASILSQPIQAQAMHLIVEPYKMINSGEETTPKVVVIDALDACERDDAQLQVLMLIAELLAVHRLPLCFLITSRSSTHLEAAFDLPVFRGMANRIPLQLFSSESDIRTFLWAGISEITSTRAPGTIPESWPSVDAVNVLVRKSDRHFLYPSTVLRYVADPRGDPVQRLVGVVIAAADDAPRPPLDQLYHHILSAAPESARHVLGLLSVLRASFSLAELQILLGLEIPHNGGLDGLSAFIECPRAAGASRVRILQQAAVEFLHDRRRSQPFWTDPRVYHARVAAVCIRFITRNLDECAPVDLTTYQYIRRRWTEHLSNSVPTAELLGALGDARFAYSRVLSEVRAVVSWLDVDPEIAPELLSLWRAWQTDLRRGFT
ncbi:unnamed protein product [Mycena citricolor]|uniref:Nephrocystin 3-like N-terminal domain-containing protein n=1 Tax=Mycena citricolor TaxID=2018698 RepID=A0AAD2Q7L4_9AGAR|nr:unnamed protein product [Mycena citricolor]